MKFLPLVLRNALRNKRRSGLTVLALAVSIFLVVALRTALHHLENPPGEGGHLRLVSRHASSLQNPLPEAHLAKVRAAPGVLHATPLTWFGGFYQDEKNQFANFATEPETFPAVFDEQRTPPEQWKAFIEDRAGAVAGEALIERFGWKIGDRIPLRGTIYPVDLLLTLRGIYAGPDDTWLLFHRDYLEESLGRPGQVGTIWFEVASASDVGPVSDRVDSLFQNSDAETKTETEKAFQLSFVEMMGDLRMIVRSVVAAVCFTMLLVAANAMAMAARERAPEAAVLRAVGFAPARVARLFLVEALGVALLGGALGAGAAALLFAWINPQPFWFPTFQVPAGIVAFGLALALGVGLFAGGGPAWRLSRLPVAAALRRS